MTEENNNTVKSEEFEFIREEIKSRPLDRRKMIKNSLLVALSAVIFGLVACLTFVFLLPLVMNYSKTDNRGNTVTSVSFPEEDPEQEMTPEDMLIFDQKVEIDYSQFSQLTEEEIYSIISSRKFTISDYQSMYQSLKYVVNSLDDSLVKITALGSDGFGANWFDDTYEGSHVAPGLIVANNGVSLFILSYYDIVKNGASVIVTFSNGAHGTVVGINPDEETGLCVLEVSLSELSELTIDAISVAPIGSSYASNLLSGVMLAVGAPNGSYGSFTYGTITSTSEKLIVVDRFYRRLDTDMYGSKNAMGFLVTANGYVVGVISNKLNTPDTENMIRALGITEIKTLITQLSNNEKANYFGIIGNDVSPEAQHQYGVPQGVYVASVEIDSPAMRAGVQAGDIITKIGNSYIGSLNNFVSALKNEKSETPLDLVISREVKGQYKDMTLNISLENR